MTTFASFASMDRHESFSNAAERAIETLRETSPDRWDFTDEEIRAALILTNDLKKVVPELLSVTRDTIAYRAEEDAEYDAARPAREAAAAQIRDIFAEWERLSSRMSAECAATGESWHSSGYFRAAALWREWQQESFGRVIVH